MSFEKYKDLIEYGDTVIIYIGYDNMIQFSVERGKVNQTKFGAVKHDALVGVRFGSKIACARGYVYVLHPTPELWTINLPHRTQILYSTDISMITTQLDIKPGSIVIEAGTGSASLSHAILRTIAPNGHLYTFDFHEQRVSRARDEFTAHGFGEDIVTVSVRDVCHEGFGIDSATANSLFLDLPSPWLAVPFAAKVLIPGGRLCTFSPCIEQVQRSCEAMRDSGFTDITTLECLQRTFNVRTTVLPVANLGYEPGHSYSCTALGNNATTNEPVVGHIQLGKGSEHRHKVKKAKNSLKKENAVEDDAKMEESNEDQDIDDDSVAVDTSSLQLDSSDKSARHYKGQRTKESYVFKSATPTQQIPGHTGFLTFATLCP